MRRARHWRPLKELLDDTVRGYPGRTMRAPHARAPAGAQVLHLQFVVASLPVAVLVAWPAPLAFAMQAATALLVAGFWEYLFAWQRRRPIDEGILLTAWLFALLAPPGTPLPEAALSLSFGVVFGKAVFGGDGRYLVSPPLLAFVFLVFAYPDTVADTVGWTPSPGNEARIALACLAGAAWLVATGSASWRLMAGAVAGLAVALALAGPAAADAAGPWYWPFVRGGLAFGIVFIATDPAASAMTNPGRLASGVLIGLLTPLCGALFAILLVSLVAPLLDAAAVARNVRRRQARERQS